MKSIGLALGGGGVRGLAHIPVLETLDAMGLRPSILAGTSMGAIVGALYASGLSGREIRRLIHSITLRKGESLRSLLEKSEAMWGWLRAMKPAFRGGGLLRTDRVLRLLWEKIEVTTFEELSIPLTVMAADFWSAEAVAFSTGDLESALQASMAVPGVFPPVERDGRVLVDGGILSLVPYDCLKVKCDLTIAIDVSGPTPRPARRHIPNMADAVMGAFEISQSAILELRVREDPPDILIQLALRDIPIFDFGKIDEVLKRGRQAAVSLRQQLEAHVPRTKRARSPVKGSRAIAR